MSSEMKPQLWAISRRRTVLVLPVSVWADRIAAPRSASIAAQWSSTWSRSTSTNRSSGSTMFVYRTWCDQVSSQFASSSIRLPIRTSKAADSGPRCSR